MSIAELTAKIENLSEEDYNNLMETLYISSIPKLKEEIIKRANASDEEFVSEDEVEW